MHCQHNKPHKDKEMLVVCKTVLLEITWAEASWKGGAPVSLLLSLSFSCSTYYRHLHSCHETISSPCNKITDVSSLSAYITWIAGPACSQ